MIGTLSTIVVMLLLAQNPVGSPPPAAPAAEQMPRPQNGTQGLATAKVLYASANYEEALNHLSEATPSEDPDQVETYRALCFIALGRDTEATQSIERMLDRNPFQSLSETEVSPRLVAMFRDVRTKRLPTAARDLYMRARTRYDEKAYVDAASLLRELLTALGREDLEGQVGLADLKLLAEGFLRLTETEIVRNGLTPVATPGASPTPPPAPAPAPPSIPPQPIVPANVESYVSTAPTRQPLGGSPAPVIYSQEDRYVVGPVEVTRRMPNWNPPPTIQRGVYHGLLEVVINERGMIEQARILISIAPSYDPLILEATKSWRFRAATLNGEPVKYRRKFEVILHPE